VTNKKFQWLNSDASRLQRLTSVELIINHSLAMTARGGGDGDVVNGIVDSSMCEGDLCCGNCKKQISTNNYLTVNSLNS